jgi:hypothetical protein
VLLGRRDQSLGIGTRAISHAQPVGGPKPRLARVEDRVPTGARDDPLGARDLDRGEKFNRALTRSSVDAASLGNCEPVV